MQITGIIAEYNPFHNGHAFQLTQARKQTDADFIIIVMSGNFVQRGAPALMDKYTRAKMALMQGADLVVELPALWSCASAEYFAGAAVSLLYQLGYINTLCYGCETPVSDVYAKICDLLADEPPAYRQLLTDNLSCGMAYARARQNALLALLPDTDTTAAAQILNNPNNILALEYQKAIAKEAADRDRPPIQIHPILRQGQAYHSSRFTDPMASASAIRRFLASHPSDDIHTLRQALPDASFQLILDYQKHAPFLYENDCSQMLHYCLLKYASAGFCEYADCTPQLSRRICRNLNDYTGFSDFCMRLKTKNLAYTRISRVLLHILLDMRADSCRIWRSRSYMPYAKILGFRKESQAVLTHLKKHASLPLLTRAADVKHICAASDSADFYQKHLFADTLYQALLLEKGGHNVAHACKRQIVIV